MRVSSWTASKIAILVQFGALIRCLAEYFRLKWVLGSALTIGRAEPYVAGTLVAALGVLVSTLFYFGEKYRTVVVTAIVDVAILVWLKFTLA